ncbi:hypothetical protein LINPERPRIM_LOCUS9566 [Linum perenne]
MDRLGCSSYLLPFLLIIASVIASQAVLGNGYNVKSATFLSPEFVLGPGSVENRVYTSIDFPTGHIGIKSFDAEVVDQLGNSIPLHQTYLHHWLLERYHVTKNSSSTTGRLVRNSGICQGTTLGQYYGLGSETRKTSTHVPDPYGIQVGNPADIPDGYEEKWLLNVHAIDTRGVEDSLGCTECLCDLYNVAKDDISESHGWCVDVKKTRLRMPTSGYVVYGVAHQHTGGIGVTLYLKVIEITKWGSYMQLCSDVRNWR